MLILIFLSKLFETVLLIKWNSRYVSIYGNEPECGIILILVQNGFNHCHKV